MIVFCAAVDCKFNNDKNRCTAKKISLSDHSIITVWDGRQRFSRCKTYEESDEAKEIRDAIEKLI